MRSRTSPPLRLCGSRPAMVDVLFALRIALESSNHRVPTALSSHHHHHQPVHRSASPFIPSSPHHHAVAFLARWTAHRRRHRLGASAPLCHLRKETDDTDSRQDLLDRAPRGVKRSRSPDDFGDAGPPGSAGDDGMLRCVSVSVCAAVLAKGDPVDGFSALHSSLRATPCV